MFSPCEYSLVDDLSTLGYASRAILIKMIVSINEARLKRIKNDQETEGLAKQMDLMRKELEMRRFAHNSKYIFILG